MAEDATSELGHSIIATDRCPSTPPSLMRRSGLSASGRSTSGRSTTTVSTRDNLRLALDEHAAGVIVFHNHLSGDPNQSGDDLVFTKRLVEAGNLLGVDGPDHLILGINRYLSLMGIDAV